MKVCLIRTIRLEKKISKIKSVNVAQTIMGIILGYNSIMCSGSARNS